MVEQLKDTDKTARTPCQEKLVLQLRQHKQRRKLKRLNKRSQKALFFVCRSEWRQCL